LEEDEELQADSSQTSTGPRTVSDSIASRIGATRGGGRSLPAETRRSMEPHFRADFSGVRVHTDGESSDLAGQLKARAFTTGRDIYFGSGNYQPDSSEGQRLIAHELTHVVQQGQAGASQVNRLPAYGTVQRDELTDEEKAEEKEKIAKAIKSRDAGDVRDIDDYSLASTDERMTLVDILLDQGWVGPWSEYALEAIWATFGLSIMSWCSNNEDHFARFKKSVAAGAELDELYAVEALKGWFRSDVQSAARGFLKKNREYLEEELGKIGISPEGNLSSDMSEEQEARLEQLQMVVELVRQAKRAQSAIRRTLVGYNMMYAHGNMAPIHAYFNPEAPPTMTSSYVHDEKPKHKWEDLKMHWDNLSGVIAHYANQYPIVYGLLSVGDKDKLEQVGTGGAQEARAAIADGMMEVRKNIIETIPKIGGDLDDRDLAPIHAQFYAGMPSQSGTDWSKSFEQWAAKDLIDDHETVEFWISLGLGTLAAAAFVVAEIATVGGATFIIAAVVAAGATAATVARSWENYEDLATAADASLSDEMTLVSKEQADAAFTAAMIDSAFAFLDIAGPAAKIIKTAGKAGKGLGAGVKTGTKEGLGEAGEGAAEGTAKGTAKETAPGAARTAAEEGSEAAGKATAKGAIKNAKFAAEGFYRMGDLVLRGTWSVVEEVVGRVTKKLYYFYDSATKRIMQIPESIANRFVKCSSCSLTDLARTGGREGAEEIGEEATEQAAKKVLPQEAKNWDQVNDLLIGKKPDEISDFDLNRLGYYKSTTSKGDTSIVRYNAVDEDFAPLTVTDGVIAAGKAKSNRISKPGALKEALEEASEAARPKGHQAHHLVPDQVVRESPLFQLARKHGYNLDNANNGVFLAETAAKRDEFGTAYSKQLPLHLGSHPEWNKLAMREAEGALTALKRVTGLPADKISGEMILDAAKNVEDAMREHIEGWVKKHGDSLNVKTD